MRRVLIAALGSAMAFAATPALAAVTLTDVNGPNLTTAIKASSSNAQNDNTTVFGCTQNNGQCANVTFTSNNALHITDGAGYAQISDVADNTLFTALTIDVGPDFSAYQFSLQLLDATYVLVQYQLAGSSAWVNAIAGDVTNPFFQAASTNKDYQITASAGELLSAIRISTCSGSTLATCNQTGTGAGLGGRIDQVKQNSINLITPAVPEPATWAMMLLGFGGIGMTMRRKQRRNGALMQVA